MFVENSQSLPLHYLHKGACMHARSLQSCLTLCDPMDCNPPGSSLLGIPQARILEQVTISSSRDLANPGIELASLMSPALAAGFFITSTTWLEPIYIKVVVMVQSLSHLRLLRPHGLQPASLFCPWDSPGKNTGVGCHFLLQGIFPTQESNQGLLHYRQILY